MGDITIVIEAIELDRRISDRMIPIWKVNNVFDTKQYALRYLNTYCNELNNQSISAHIDYEILYIDHDPGFNIGKRYFILKDIIVYGDYIYDYIYNLVLYENHSLCKPYGYNTLGWFSSKEWCYATKEWQIFKSIIEDHIVDGAIQDDTIKLFAPYDSCFMPYLYIHSYKIKRQED